MNIKEYIESGILEAYVSGAATDQERKEVVCLSSVYPEIQAELDALEETMNQYAMDRKVPAPIGLKSKTMDIINNTIQLPAKSVESDHSNTADQKTDNQPPATVKSSGRDPSKFPWRIAAMILLLISCGLLYFLVTLEDDYKNEIDGQKENIAQLKERLDNLALENDSQNEQLALVTSPSTLKIPLTSPTGVGQDNALVFWDQSNNKVYLDTEMLPAAPNDKQYQLWALKGNRTIDLGTVLKGDFGFQQMKNAEEADAFAITLEPLGGSELPTMEQLKVTGKI